ncbi:MAG: hypothetical protein KJO57_09810 [Deltaproteobacteria bacterium]|nr:hypothetical protein [Deltaproteobacteria bacterium]
MRIFLWTLGLSVTTLMLFGCANTAGEVCGPGAFSFSGATGLVTREVCFHSLQTIPAVDGCDIYNYRISPEEDFSDYIDIFWDPDPGCETNDFDGSFEQAFTDASGAVIRTARFNLSGTSPGLPPQAPGNQVMGGGEYNTDDGEQGTFTLTW